MPLVALSYTFLPCPCFLLKAVVEDSMRRVLDHGFLPPLGTLNMLWAQEDPPLDSVDQRWKALYNSYQDEAGTIDESRWMKQTNN